MKINDLNKLFYFKEAAELLNYTKAAKKLQSSPSGIQQAVRALEESLGHKLFIRKSKGLALTPEGKILYDRVVKSFKELSLAEKELDLKKKILSHRLKIITSPGLAAEWICMSLPSIKETYPDLTIELISSNFEVSLESEDFDIFIGPKIETNPAYKYQLLTTVTFKVYASTFYITNYGRPLTIKDLEKHKLVKFSGLLQAYYSDANKIFSNLDEDYHYDYIVDSYLAEFNLVNSGKAIACLATQFVKTRNKNLVDLFPQIDPIVVDIFIYYNLKIGNELLDTILASLNLTSPYNS